MEKEKFDFDYFERGIETGKSNYQNYRWIPELTIPMAMSIIDFLEIKRGDIILDIGCAKGYLVKALRLLHRDAWGADISNYALTHADEDTKQFLFKADFILMNRLKAKFVICKDVLEHIPVNELKELLNGIQAEKILTIVPLGQNGKYFAGVDNMDISHIICEGKQWWLDLFADCNWELLYAEYKMPGIKEHYSDMSGCHLFMTHRRKI